MADVSSSIVDEAPISPVKNTERRQSLEHFFVTRPERSELVEKNILLASTAAPAIQAHQKELERHMLADKIDKGLKHRPDREELVEKNILPQGHAAPALLAHQKELEKHMRADKLDEALKHRKSPEELMQAGVLHDDPRSPIEEKQVEAT